MPCPRQTRLSAAELLAGLQRIEASHGRTRTEHWTSRTLDLDIIDVDGLVSEDPECDVAASACMAAGFRIGAVACA